MRDVCLDDLIEIREVSGFERLELRDQTSWIDLTIEPGEREALMIAGPPETRARIRSEVRAGTLTIALEERFAQKLRNALITSRSRRSVRYHLTARRLTTVTVFGAAPMVHVNVNAFGAEKPAITYVGAAPCGMPMPSITSLT